MKVVEGAEPRVQILQDGAMQENIHRMLHPSQLLALPYDAEQCKSRLGISNW
jgi:hypothetical protein